MALRNIFYLGIFMTFIIGVVMSILIAFQARWTGYGHWTWLAITIVGTLWLLIRSKGEF